MNDHIPYLSLSTVVKEYCLATFNDKRKYFINYMVHAKWIWKDLFQNSLFVVKNVYVKVDKTTKPYSIVIPKDSVRFINLSYEGIDGSLQSFVHDSTINDTVIPLGNECQQCGDTNDYGQCINNISAITKTVTLLGDDYTETTWMKISPAGDLLEVREIPTISVNAANEQSVEMIMKERILCKFEMKSCGCIKKVDINRTLINKYCGVLLHECQLQMIQPTTTKVATYKGRIKISNGRIWISGDNIPDYVIHTFQTNGVCGESEIMIPEECVTAMMFGIAWRSTALAPNKVPLEKRTADIAFEKAKQELEEFLNPIRCEEFMAVQQTIPLWGSGADQSFMVQ